MKRWQADIFDIAAERIIPAVLDAWVSEGDGNTSIQSLITELEDWEYEMDIDIKAPTIWTYLLDAIKFETFDELRSVNIGATSGFTPVLEQLIIEENAYYFDDHSTDGEIEEMDEILVLALHRTFNEMVKDLGKNMSSWIYGNHHIIYIDHLASLTFIGGEDHRGGRHTLNVAGGWEVRGGPSRRMVVNFDDTPEFYSVYPGGQSQNMFSNHWDDLFERWYSFDEDTQTYGYYQEYFYATATEFSTADQADSDVQMIERYITFIP